MQLSNIWDHGTDKSERCGSLDQEMAEKYKSNDKWYCLCFGSDSHRKLSRLASAHYIFSFILIIREIVSSWYYIFYIQQNLVPMSLQM